MAWVLALHIIAMVAWFAGLFYLPRLFVYHAVASDEISLERFVVMERRLYWGIMLPAAVLTIGLGVWLLSLNWGYYMAQGWMHAKLLLVLLLVIFHIYCGVWMSALRRRRNRHSQRFYRIANEVPTLLLLGIVIMVVVKPF